MSERVVVTTFSREADLLAAIRGVRAGGWRPSDAYAPYAVHGLDEALGLRPSRLGWVCGLLAVAGATCMLWFQYWTSAVDWPINVGGKPLNSLPAFVPVVFEAAVLVAGVGTVLAFLMASRLRPGRKPSAPVPGISDDRFALIIEETDATFDMAALRRVLKQHGAVIIEERVPAQGHGNETAGDAGHVRESRANRLLGANVALMVALCVSVVAVWLGSGDGARRNWHFLPTMLRSPAYDVYETYAELPHGNAPVAGTLARDEHRLRYPATEEGAQLAGRELRNPVAGEDQAVRRGAAVYQSFCAACHGSGGQGDGGVSQRGYPPPPSLVTGDSVKMPDGQLFHIITYGRQNMPAHGNLLGAADRWKVILHIRKLQGKEVVPEAEAAEESNQSHAGNEPAIEEAERENVP